ncbi:hypothetical protein LGL08_18660 [Clostridium estertheticum]|uniref:hypothetical protein n=1 Tax=Clostridium estertheticum TaxID=238834 RepID=UPI001CF44775|nr:hypothetical protein [Clostridium estertheticum]MCB2308493.1 hypothetical protein [Clostridium estertheticum]MCB2346901.1 hypothetical protein [Clostridium estertheticum]MCB2351551.1 hypothetical protein [Clostridium estertheticum]WAG46631.1 hypothetical protein LL127_03510 [Clostridium estertheticum]
MKNIPLKTKILTGILTGGIYLSSVSTTFALTTTPINISGNKVLTSECKQINTKTKQNLKTDLEEPIITSTITQAQANKIKSLINKSKTTKVNNIDYAKTIINSENKLYKSNTNINYINPITTLVDNGTINQTQADKILMKQLYLYHEKMLKSSL